MVPAEELPLADRVEETQTAVEEKWAAAASNLGAAKATYKKHYDRRGSTQARDFNVGDYVYLRNHTRTSGLDPFYHGPYEVLAVDELTVTVRSERRGDLTVHKNHVRPSQTTDVVVLPSAVAPDVPLEEVAVEDVAVVPPVVEPPAGLPAAVYDPDMLDVPIAFRRPIRYKPRGIGEDFVPR